MEIRTGLEVTGMKTIQVVVSCEEEFLRMYGHLPGRERDDLGRVQCWTEDRKYQYMTADEVNEIEGTWDVRLFRDHTEFVLSAGAVLLLEREILARFLNLPDSTGPDRILTILRNGDRQR